MKTIEKYQTRKNGGICLFVYFLFGIGFFDLSAQCNISYSPSSITFNAIGEVQTITLDYDSGCRYSVRASSFYFVGLSGNSMKVKLLNSYFDSGAPSEDKIALVDPTSGFLLALIPVTISVAFDMPSDNTFSNENYILSRTFLNEFGSSYLDNVEYYDGLGRPVQTVLKASSPMQKDLVTLQEYEGVGRPSNLHLPTPVSTSTGTYVAPTTLKSASNAFYSDAAAYSKPIYESSPLNRVKEQYGPGIDWHYKGQSVKTDWMTNTSSGECSCGLYSVASDASLKRSGVYAVNELFVTQTTDEDGNTSYTFRDKLGQMVLERVMNGSVMNDTYYVYDDFGNLRYVLPPAVSDALSTTATWADTHAVLSNLAYIYKYDGRNRCTRKKLPGCDAIEMRYDKSDRLIFSQDGNQRVKGEWSFFFYDVFGRQTVTGIWKSNAIPALDNLVVKTDYTGTGNLAGYTVNLTLASVDLMTVNYYDDYSFSTGLTALAYTVPPTGYGSRYESAKGLLTGSRTYQLNDPSKYTLSVLYYDHRGRVVQNRSTNHLGGNDDAYYGYTFTGKVKQHRLIHTAPGKTTQTEEYIYTYDHAERLLSVSHKLNSSAAVTMAGYTYDEVGRVKTKKLGTETSTYNYNIRSWLTGITGTKFNQTLAYNQAVNGITPTKPLYNGNIGAMKWKSGAETTERGYKFTYDGLNRLTAASYGEGASLTANLNRFNESVGSYDKSGNILTLQRQGKLNSGYGLMDNLTYSYSGNKLTKVTDAVTTAITYPGAFHFVDGANVATEYTYDANGNLTKDLNKKIASISYNTLNLPKVVSFSDGNSITYGYDASGNKLSAAYKVGSTTVKTEYAGNKVYKNGTLSMILTEEGYITLSGTTPTYHYFLKDHQGNNRVVINQSGTVEQVNHYYPFGGLFGEGVQTSNQPYKYNGKELDRQLNLNLYDYGARHYDAALGRWLTVDPMAEKYYGMSSYVYTANNPVRFVDPDGRIVRLANNYVGGIENIARIAATSLGSRVMSHLIRQKEVYTLNSTFWTASSSYNPKNRDINYVGNPWYKEIPFDGGALNSMVAMGHETFHAFDHSNYVFNSANAGYSKDIVEPRAVSFGNYLRQAYSLSPLREQYGNIKGNFHQFTGNEEISNFTTLGNNSDKTSYGFSYTKTTTIVESYKTFLGIKTPDKTRTETATYYMTVSRDKNNNVSFQTFSNEEAYKKATSNW